MAVILSKSVPWGLFSYCKIDKVYATLHVRNYLLLPLVVFEESWSYISQGLEVSALLLGQHNHLGACLFLGHQKRRLPICLRSASGADFVSSCLVCCFIELINFLTDYLLVKENILLKSERSRVHLWHVSLDTNLCSSMLCF